MLDQLTVEDFESLVGDAFRIDYPQHSEVLTLAEVTRAKHDPPPGFRAAFSLTFKGESRDVMLGQRMYCLQHAALGSLELLLVPAGRLPLGNFRYEVVFG